MFVKGHKVTQDVLITSILRGQHEWWIYFCVPSLKCSLWRRENSKNSHWWDIKLKESFGTYHEAGGTLSLVWQELPYAKRTVCREKKKKKVLGAQNQDIVCKESHRQPANCYINNATSLFFLKYSRRAVPKGPSPAWLLASLRQREGKFCLINKPRFVI